MAAWLLVIFLSAAPARANGVPDELKSAVRHDKAGPAEAERLIALASDPDPWTRQEALMQLSDSEFMQEPWLDKAFIARLQALAVDKGRHDPSIPVRHAAGDLSQSVSHWDTWWSPRAKAEERRRDWRMRHHIDDLPFLAGATAIVLIILCGGMLVAASQATTAWLVIHAESSQVLEEDARSSWSFFWADPALLVLPAVNAVLFASLGALSFWKVFADPANMTPAGHAEIYRRAVAIAYQPSSLAAIVVVFTLSMLVNAAYLSAHVRRRRGEDAGLAAGLVDAARCAGTVVALAVPVALALIGLERISQYLEERSTYWEGQLIAYSDLAAESAALLTLNVALCAALFEGQGPVGSMRRAVEVLQPQWRRGMRAVAATTIMRGEPLKAAVIAPAMCYPYTLAVGAIFLSEDYSYWLLNGGLEALVCGCFVLSFCCAGFILSLCWLLDAIFAASCYLHAVGHAAMPEAFQRRLAASTEK